MKWIKVHEGKYKLVDDDDPRPEDRQFARRKKPGGVPFIINKPPWAESEHLIHTGNDVDTQLKAADQFENDRTRWTGMSNKYRQWEEDRKKEWRKNKPLWRKKRMESDPLLALKSGIKPT